MSYLDYFLAENIGKAVDDRDGQITGTCYEMCPQVEIDMREKASLVHVLEVMGPARCLVKSFCRSAADANMAVPALLRPYEVLLKTVRHLLFDVTKRQDVPMPVVYDFVNDRLRAVRQDMTIQRLPARQCAELLEPMVRFYVYYGYRLCELPLKDYDPVLNKKCLLECIKWFLSCCDECESNNTDELSNFLSNLTIKDKYDRILVEKLYIMCNLDESVHPLMRYLSLPNKIKRDPSLRRVYRIAVSNLRGNYIRTCRAVKSLCPLTFCAFCVYLPVLQRRSLQVLSTAYSSRQMTVPVAVIRTWLCFASDSHVAAACRQLSCHVTADAVRFDRKTFGNDAVLPAKRLLEVEKLFDLSLEHVFTYHSVTDSAS